MIKILRAMWPYLRPYRVTLFLALVAMLGETVTALLAPWPLQFVFDRILLVRSGRVAVLAAPQWRLLLILTGVAVAIAVADAVLTYVDGRLSEVAAQKAVYELRRTLFGHLQRLSIAFHQSPDNRLGDLLSRLSGDIGALQDLAAEGVSNLVTNGLTLAAMAAVMLWLNWQMAVAALALTIPTAFYTRRNTLLMRQALKAARQQEGKVSALLQESLSYIKLVQAYGREEAEARRLRRASDRSLSASIRAATLLARLAPSVSLMSAFGYALLVVLGAVQVVKGRLTPGELLVFLSYVRSTQSPIRQLAKLSYSVAKASASLDRIEEILDTEPTIRQSRNAVPLWARGPVDVEFRDVTFGYTPGRTVLRNVSLSVEPGELVAIVGSTGSGKSTLMSLLPRFYDPWSGAVAVAGRDVRGLTLWSLRASISLVLQDSLIFRTSVLDNIAYGRPDASLKEVIAAAEASGAAMVAARLEDGFDTVVSERGASLSGGEKQCIGIARAMLKDAPIVVLDEPTSAMDASTERLVMAGIERLLHNRTGFIIAHRLATVMQVDRVIVMEDGRIVEAGPPARLLADPGTRFAALASAQLIADPSESALKPREHARPPAAPMTVPPQPGQPHPVRGAGIPAWNPQPHQRLTPQRPMIPLRDAVRAGHAEGYWLGAAAARDAPGRWVEAVIAGKPRLPADLLARLTRGSHLPAEALAHDNVQIALRQGFWDGLERGYPARTRPEPPGWHGSTQY